MLVLSPTDLRYPLAMTRLQSILLLTGALLLCTGLAMGELPQEWRLRTWQDGQQRLTKPSPASDQNGVLLPLAFPGRTECVTGIDQKSWSNATGKT